MHRIAKLLLISTLMVFIGAQWAVLQSAAWIGMAVTYSIKAGSVEEGLSKTFDGEHPCRLCCLVKRGSDSEKRGPKQENTKQKFELFAGVTEAIIIAPTFVFHFPGVVQDTAVPRTLEPPTHPPRCASA